MNFNTKLRIEISKNISGTELNFSRIPILKEKNYYIIPQTLDGDAPKEFIGAYFYSKNNSFTRKNPKSWSKYIAKTAEKWYPNESVIEYIINKFGEKLDLNMNETELIFCNGQIRFLSKYFLEKNEILLHGAEICGDYLNDRKFAEDIALDKIKAREFFTFEFIIKALDHLFKNDSEQLKINFVKMLVFDCLMGNNDRHFYNWGVITNTHRNVKLPKFAPVYDSARGLLWNSDDNKIKHIFNQLTIPNSKIFENYIQKAEPRVSLENNKKANHFELIEYIIQYKEEYKVLVKLMSSEANEKNIIQLFREKYSQFFISERQIVIEQIITKRFNKTRELIL